MILKINNVDFDVVEVDDAPRHKLADGTWHDLPMVMHKQLYEAFHGHKYPHSSLKEGYASFMSCGLNS